MDKSDKAKPFDESLITAVNLLDAWDNPPPYRCHDDYTEISNLPYGMWVCSDGSEVLFNRGYQPMFERRKGDGCWKITENRHIHFRDQLAFRDEYQHDVWAAGEDGQQAQKRCIRILVDFLVGADLSQYVIER